MEAIVKKCGNSKVVRIAEPVRHKAYSLGGLLGLSEISARQ